MSNIGQTPENIALKIFSKSVIARGEQKAVL
jgi:hypothetical protein